MNQEQDEITIDLADLLAHILHRWKTIAIWTIALMIVVGGFMSYRDYSAIQSKYEDTTLHAIREGMTESQLTTVDQFYARYQAYQQQIDDNQYYIDHSLRMKLDPNNVSKYVVEYLVKSDYQGAMNSLIASSFDKDIYEAMAKALGKENLDARYVYELINLSGNLSPDTNAYILAENTNIPSDHYTGILTLTIKTNNRSNSEQIATIADTAIQRHQSDLKSAGISITLSPLTTSYTEIVDAELATYQQGIISTGSDLFTTYQKFESSASSSLDEQELNLFNYLIDKEQQKEDSIHWKKWLVLGLAAGLFIGLMIVVIKYFLKPGIKTEDELSRYIDAPLLGVVREAPNSKVFFGKRIHKWANAIENHGKVIIPEDKAVPIICDRISLVAEEQQTKNIYLIKSVESSFAASVIDRIMLNLKERGLHVSLGNPSMDNEALLTLSQSDAAILIVSPKNTLVDSIKTNQSICNDQHLPIWGHIVLHSQS